MCTAISYKTKEHYFGRNLDLEYSLGESVVIMPRGFSFEFRHAEGTLKKHAIIGTAIVKNGVPLFYDGTNEKGLSMAGLNFVGNAFFHEMSDKATNIAPFELIPWVLRQCDNVKQAKSLLNKTNIVNLDFSEEFPAAQLHWLISDDKQSITLESTKDGIFIYDNPVGVLTNNPPFPFQMFNLNNFMQLTNQVPENSFCKSLPLEVYSRGMGAMGLPGDFSSLSRFVRAVFTKTNSVYHNSEQKRVSQFFHLLYSVYQPRGAVQLPDGRYEHTVYSSCCNTKKGIYYYTTYYNSTVNAVKLHNENLDGESLCEYPMIFDGSFNYQNENAPSQAKKET